MRISPTLLALLILSVPAPCWSAMPGQPCEKGEIGRTEKSDTEQDIIACLKTGQSSPAQIWKAMTNGSGGITGGCAYINFAEVVTPVAKIGTGTVYAPDRQYAIIDNWGDGCKADGLYQEDYNCTNANCFVAKSEYKCGTTSDGQPSLSSISVGILNNHGLPDAGDSQPHNYVLHRVSCIKKM